MFSFCLFFFFLLGNSLLYYTVRYSFLWSIEKRVFGFFFFFRNTFLPCRGVRVIAVIHVACSLFFNIFFTTIVVYTNTYILFIISYNCQSCKYIINIVSLFICIFELLIYNRYMYYIIIIYNMFAHLCRVFS